MSVVIRKLYVTDYEIKCFIKNYMIFYILVEGIFTEFFNLNKYNNVQ